MHGRAGEAAPPKLYKISILYNFDELNDPTGRRAPVPAITTFPQKIVDIRDYLC